MYQSQNRPSEVIAMQRDLIRQQEAIIETLKGALAAAGVDDRAVVAFGAQPWMVGLTPQERALIGALYSRYPRPADKYNLLDLIPGRDHAMDRQAQIVSILVCRVRKKLGHAAIENVRGQGYQLGRELRERIRAEKLTLPCATAA